ncbi:enoyl-CoA hydratase/isomerase family protein [Eoetvoesiella caeni]
MSTSVLFETWPTAGRQNIAVATLNRPASLNGLTLEMCRSLSRQLARWEADSSIALIVLRGSGEKAFCAGGDIRELYSSVLANVGGRPWDNTLARQFFETEYRLDYAIHTCAKPVLCWGSGIVFGGGVGLMMGASHRVVTESTRFAMPEISIGIFPDVGGTWMLGRLADGIGMFLALTGAQLVAGDCRFLGLADYSIDSSKWTQLRHILDEQPWTDARRENDIRLDRALRTFESDPDGGVLPGPLQNHYTLIKGLCAGPDFDAICENLLSLTEHEDAWLRRAAMTFREGSPGSARLSFELLKRVRRMSLADAFRQEYTAVLQCMAMGDFPEGVRALLIDKDKSPRWNPRTLASASNDWAELFFTPSWPQGAGHPLADMEQRTHFAG